jgi:hypothetical protein
MHPSSTRYARRAQPFAISGDPARELWNRFVAHLRDRIPAFAHHSDYEIDLIFGDLRCEITEAIDSIIIETRLSEGE